MPKLDTLYINFVAGPSSGKSTMSALTYVELKSLHKSVEMVQEYAKMLVYMEDYEMLNCQWMVSYRQYQQFKALQGKVEYVCCDSPLVIGMFYNRYYQDNVSDIPKTEAMIKSKLAELSNCVYVFLERNPDFPFETEGRMQGEEESKRIDKQMKDLLDELGVEYLTVRSGHQSVKDIVEYILSKKERENAFKQDK